LYDLREKWICDFGDDQSEDSAASRNKGPRLPVGVIAELLDSLPYSFCQLGIHGGHLVDGARYRCRRYFGPSGDVTNVHGSSFISAEKSCYPQYTLSQVLSNLRAFARNPDRYLRAKVKTRQYCWCRKGLAMSSPTW